ncbi:hypothetical protein EYC80_003248 [Monilinia laxa]|uniref:Uncharacterized protein n=1 Tax=Monilinia laxa TaxID=61186 RepID=A0A5N6KEF5_MONLA|nr:hypothetical protein EYC80_003248 [Monilinia laxa]
MIASKRSEEMGGRKQNGKRKRGNEKPRHDYPTDILFSVVCPPAIPNIHYSILTYTLPHPPKVLSVHFTLASFPSHLISSHLISSPLLSSPLAQTSLLCSSRG